MPAHLSQSHTPRFLFPLRWGSVNPVLSPCQAGRYRGRWAGPVPVGGRHAGWGLSRVLPGETPGLDRPRGWSSGRTSDERHWWSPTSASTEWRRCPVAMATRDCSTRVAGGARPPLMDARDPIMESGRRDSNPRPSPWQVGAFRLHGRLQSPAVPFRRPSFHPVH